MNLSVINLTIQALCEEVVSLQTEDIKWQQLTEDELLYELAVCIIGSQVLYEVAVAATDRLKKLSLLSNESISMNYNMADYMERVRDAFMDPLDVQVDGKLRRIRLRFANRLSSLLAATIQNIYGKDRTIRQIICSTKNSMQARESLVSLVVGFGPKQASLFLRRVGYCTELAVLDTHIVDYLKLANGAEIKSGSLAKLSFYEKIEVEFKRVAKKFGHSVGCVDLAMWITMRVAKKELQYEHC